MDSLIEGPISRTPVQDEPVHLNAAGTDENTERQAATPYEPFLQDWYPAPAERIDAGSLTLTNRQLAIVGFVVILAVGLMAGLGYVAGRVASNGPSRVLMLESAQASPAPVSATETLAFAPSVATGAAAPAQAQANAAIVQKATPVPPQPRAASSFDRSIAFWQVGALDPGMAKVSEQYLLDRGVPVRLEAIAGSKQMRVLVGPAEGQELSDLKVKLDGLGFQTLLKRY